MQNSINKFALVSINFINVMKKYIFSDKEAYSWQKVSLNNTKCSIQNINAVNIHSVIAKNFMVLVRKSNCQHEGSGTKRRMPSKEVFLKDPSPYLSEFLKNQKKKLQTAR